MTICKNGSKEILISKSKIIMVAEGTYIFQIGRDVRGKDARESMTEVLDLLFPDKNDINLLLTDTYSHEDGGVDYEYSFSTENITDVSILNSFGESLTDTLVLFITNVKVQKHEY
jgi:hypothetical protein